MKLQTGCPPLAAPPPPGEALLACENVGEGIATGDLQGWMLGPKDIQKEGGETAQDAQEAEGGDDPEEQHRLGVHAEICGGEPDLQGPKQLPGAGSPSGWGLSPISTVLGSQGSSRSSCSQLATRRRPSPRIGRQEPWSLLRTQLFPSNKPRLSAGVHFVVLAALLTGIKGPDKQPHTSAVLLTHSGLQEEPADF